MKGILFDLDGTLLDRQTSLEKWIYFQYDLLALSERGVERDAFVNRFIELDDHGHVDKYVVYETLCDEWQLTDLDPATLFEQYDAYMPQFVELYPGAKSLLQTLKTRGYKLGMITNGRTTHQMNNMKALDIVSFFDVILISEQERLKKPDARLFYRALERLDVYSHDACFVGDHPINDIEGAKNAGLQTIWFNNGYWPTANGDYEITHLNDMYALIKSVIF